MDNLENANAERLKRIHKKFHKTLPKVHVLLNREMNELEGGHGRNKEFGTYSTATVIGCPRP